MTIVTKGAIRVHKLDGNGGAILRTVVKRADEKYNWLEIKAGAWHTIIAEEDGTHCLCAYAPRNPETGEVSLEHSGWAGAYQ